MDRFSFIEIWYLNIVLLFVEYMFEGSGGWDYDGGKGSGVVLGCVGVSL